MFKLNIIKTLLIFLSITQILFGSDQKVLDHKSEIYFSHHPIFLQTPLIKKSKDLYMPLRDVLKELNASLKYNRREDVYIFESPTSSKIILIPNSKKYVIGNQKKYFSDPIFFHQQRIYVSIKEFTKAIGFDTENRGSSVYIFPKSDPKPPQSIQHSLKAPISKSPPEISIPLAIEKKSNQIKVLASDTQKDHLTAFKIPNLSQSAFFMIKSKDANSKITTFTIIKGILYADLSPFFKATGYKVTQKADRIIIQKKDMSYEFLPGKQMLYVIGNNSEKETPLDYLLVQKNNKTLFPVLSFLSSIGFNSHWDHRSASIHLLNKIDSITIKKTDNHYDLEIKSMRDTQVSQPFFLDNPKRVYWDISHASFNHHTDKITLTHPDIKTVQYGQHLNKGRLVLKIDHFSPFQTNVSTTPPTIRPITKKQLLQKNNALPLKGKRIAIDPGHGGWDPGAIGINRSQEKIYTYDISKRLKNAFEKKGATVYMLRTGDKNPSLYTRVTKANRSKADILLSIHINSFIKPSARGTETFYYKQIDKKLAENVHRSLVSSLKFYNKGLKRSRMYVLRHSKMPSVLVEPLFMSNPTEYSKLKNASFREQISKAIVSGVENYFK